MSPLTAPLQPHPPPPVGLTVVSTHPPAAQGPHFLLTVLCAPPSPVSLSARLGGALLGAGLLGFQGVAHPPLCLLPLVSVVALKNVDFGFLNPCLSDSL